MVKRKKGGKKKNISTHQQGGFLTGLISGLSNAYNVGKKAYDLGQEYKPATKLTSALNTFGVNTDPNKSTSNLGKLATTGLAKLRSWGFGQQNGGGSGFAIGASNNGISTSRLGVNQVQAGRGRKKVIKV
jgi:hypothetical protein